MTARKNEARVVPGLAENQNTDAPIIADLHDGHVQARDEHCKKFETLRAKLALRGYEVHRTDHGAFIVRKWGLTRTCSGLDEAEAFALQAGCSTDA